MTTDFRALCAELVNELADFQWAAIEAGVGWAHPDTEDLITRARAALADEPAVPDGIERDAARYRWIKAAPRLRIDRMPDSHFWISTETGEKYLVSHSLSAFNTGFSGLPTLDDLVDQAMNMYPIAPADEPTVPEGREPAAVTGQPSDEELESFLVDVAAQHGDIYWAEPLVLARAVLARWGSPAPAPQADVSQLSDGYHTFAELYEHRHSLMLALMRAQPHICWFSRRHADGELPFGSDDWFIVGAELPGAPITYHLPVTLYSLAQKTGATELPTGRPWDGHTAADVVQRLRNWAIEPALPADGEVAELVAWLRQEFVRNQQIGNRTGALQSLRAAELLQRQALVPVPVSEGPWEREGWCDEPGRCWWGRPDTGDWSADWTLATPEAIAEFCEFSPQTVCLPAHALPIPKQQESDNG